MCKFHSIFLSADGRVFTCGHGTGGRLGHGDEKTLLVSVSCDFVHDEDEEFMPLTLL